MLNPFAHTGRVDCKLCKERRYSKDQTRKDGCHECGGKHYVTICLICEEPFPKKCHCYDWMYEEQWFWDKVNNKS